MLKDRFGLSGAKLVYSDYSVKKYMDLPHIQASRLASIQGIRTPDIMSIGITSYTMKRISGDNLVDYLQEHPDRVCSLYPVLDWIMGNLKRSQRVTIDKFVFYTKIEDIIKKCRHTIDRSIRRKIYDLLDGKGGYIVMPIGQTHGDPTLENIMVADGETYLIDPIPSFVESPLVDLSKILQDILHGWHRCRSLAGFSTEVYNEFFTIADSIRVNCEFEWKLQLKVMEFMTIARILPYCKNMEQFEWCQKKLNRI